MQIKERLLYNALNESEIIEALGHSDAMKGARGLQHMVLDKQLLNQDNSTAIVLRLQGEEGKKTHSFLSLHARAPFIISVVIVMLGCFLIKTKWILLLI